jgi:hypothetical protein
MVRARGEVLRIAVLVLAIAVGLVARQGLGLDERGVSETLELSAGPVVQVESLPAL